MKKIIYITIFLLLILGNNNYQELSNLAIITNIAIEKNNNLYTITFQEIIPKKEENKITKTYNYYKNTSSSLKQAFNSLSEDITKDIYLEHLENIIIKDDNLKIIYDLEKVLKSDLDNFNIIFSKPNPIEVLKYSSDYKYVNHLIKDNTTLRSIKKAKLEKKKIKIPIVTFKNKRLIFYKYKEVGEFKNA